MLAKVAEVMVDCGARLQVEGVDLEGYTTPEVAEDTEAARMALIHERVNLFSRR